MNTQIDTRTQTMPVLREEPNVGHLLALVIEKMGGENAGSMVEAVTKLVELQERMDATRAKREFAEDLARFQSECPVIPHNRDATVNAGFKFSFADRAQIERVAGPIYRKYGFATSFDSAHGDTWRESVCTLHHRSGHSMTARFRAEMDTRENRAISNAQKAAAAQSFADRRAISAVLGISTSNEDTDGAVPPGDLADRITEHQVADLEALISEVGANRTQYLKWLKVERLSELPAAEFSKAVTALERKRAGK